MVALLGPISDILYTKDWWTPQFIFGSTINFEAIIVAFMIGGIGTVIYEDIFHQKVIDKKRNKKQVELDLVKIFMLTGLGLFIFFGAFIFFKLNSLQATILGLMVPTFIIWGSRKDLIFESILTGLFLVLIAAIVYTIIDVITPGWVYQFWHFTNVPKILFLNVPIDDIFWYFTTGLFIGPLYEYWHEAKLRRVPVRIKKRK
jgi:hypothetical protein